MKFKYFNMRLLQISTLLLVLGILGCKDDIDTFTPNPLDVEQKGDISNFFAEFEHAFDEEFKGWADQRAIFVTKRESIVEIPPNTLVDATGSLAKGLYDVTIVELRTPGEILLAGKPTHSYGDLLSSAAEFYISVTQNGQPLRLSDGERILLRIPDPAPEERMELWYLDSDYDEVTSRLEETWDDADDDPNQWDNVIRTEWTVQADSGQILTDFGYECWSDSLSWINIDLFMDLPPEEVTDVCVELPEEYGNVNTAVFIIFRDFNGIIALPGDPDEMQFCNLYTAFIKVGVPIGAPVTFVIISEQEEDCYFFALKDTVIEENHVEIIDPVKTDFEEIKDIIMGL
jgi:hypothetical protein